MKTQKQMWHAAEQRSFTTCRTFNEIQQSGNPLTPTEVDQLITKRPEVYGILRAWGTSNR